MADDHLRLIGESSSLVDAINQSVDVYNRLIDTQSNLVRSTANVDKNMNLLRGTVERQTKDGKRIIETWKTVKDTYRLTNVSIVDATEKINREREARQKLLRIQEAANAQLVRERNLKQQQAEQLARLQTRAYTKGADAAITHIRSTIIPSQFEGTEVEAHRIARAESALKKFIVANQIATSRVRKMWAEVQTGSINTYSGKLADLQSRLLTLARAHSQYGSTAIREHERAAKAAERADEASQGMLLTWQSIGRLAILQVGHKLVSQFTIAVAESWRQAVEFEKVIAQIRTIDKDDLPFGDWAVGVRELSDSWGTDLIDQARGAYFALSNQVADGANAFRFLHEANKLAVTGLATTEQSVNLLTSVINAFNLDVSETERVAASMFRTVELGRVLIGEMSDTLGRIAVPAAQLGVTYDELNAAIATATINGVKFNEAGTLIRNILLKLIRPTEEMKRFFAELGVESGEAAIQTFGFSEFLAKLEERSRGSSKELGELFGRIRAITGAMLFAGDGLERYQNNLAMIEGGQDRYARATQLIMENAGKRLEIEINKIKNFFTVDLANSVLRGIADATGGFVGLARGVEIVTKAIIVGLIPAVAALTVALTKFALANPWVRIVSLVSAVAAGLVVVVETMGTFNSRIREAAREFEKLNQEHIDNLNKQINESLRLLELHMEERVRVIRRSIADTIAQYNAEHDAQEEIFKSLEASIKLTSNLAVKEVKAMVTASEKEVDRLTKQIDSLKKELFIGPFDAEKGIFEFDYQFLEDAVEQVNLITSRIQRVRQLIAQAANTGDKTMFDRLTDELNELVMRRASVIQGEDKSLETHLRLRQDILATYQAEQALRQKMLEDNNEQLATEQQRLEERRKKEEEVIRLYTELKNFNVKQALEAGDFDDQLNQQVDRVNRIIDLQNEFGLDEVRSKELIDLLYEYQFAKERELAKLQEKNYLERVNNEVKALTDAAKRAEQIRDELEDPIQRVNELIRQVTELGTDSIFENSSLVMPLRRAKGRYDMADQRLANRLTANVNELVSPDATTKDLNEVLFDIKLYLQRTANVTTEEDARVRSVLVELRKVLTDIEGTGLNFIQFRRQLPEQMETLDNVIKNYSVRIKELSDVLDVPYTQTERFNAAINDTIQGFERLNATLREFNNTRQGPVSFNTRTLPFGEAAVAQATQTTTVNHGDITVNLNSSGIAEVDAQKIVQIIRTEQRKGTLRSV